MQQKKNKKCFIVNCMILTFLTIRNSKSSKVITIFRGDSEKLSKEFKKLQINSNNDEKKITQQHVDDDDEVYNNPNLHSEEQDELEIPDDGF
ncbi:unnamed protein product [Rhizophagus irregularis]|uniref:Uncharacterized protein n=1 Tax=Rhizophagus irregularis TaxID=588596 RepID=A0A915ZHI6_9GLOM|nr:unnamed protein product [Rhizophagus irregularis]CAB5377233.1 unnamed protein product [Rhizophagus irregularis]